MIKRLSLKFLHHWSCYAHMKILETECSNQCFRYVPENSICYGSLDSGVLEEQSDLSVYSMGNSTEDSSKADVSFF